MKKYEIIAKNSEGEGLLPMKQSKEKEAKKSKKQRNQESCNFIKNAFVINGTVKLVKLEEPFIANYAFLATDKERGEFYISIS